MDSAIPQRQARRGSPASPHPEAGAGSVAAAFLDGMPEGLLLVERDGRVALCSSQARRALGLGPEVVGRPLRHLLAALGRGRAGERRVALMRLRGPLRRGEPASLDLTSGGVPLALDVKPLAGAGWSVAVEALADRAARLEGAADGGRDPLTALPTRARFTAALGEAGARLERSGRGFAVLAVDLDRFEQVNDTLGHRVGDALLRKVAERLATALGPADAAARFGGDAFAVLQDGVSRDEDAAVLARRIVDLLGRAYMVEGHLINIGASVGVALAPTDGADAAALIRNADLALRRAKLDGRGGFRFFEPEMDERVQARRRLELDLRRAVAAQEFELVYQPQMNLETNRIVGCEALIRWRHPERGTVSPGDFIPLAEEVGLIVGIGEWVLRTACREAARWPGDLTVAVNLSPAQFRGGGFVATVASALEESGLDPRRLELEITEGLLLHDSEANVATLHALRGLGLRIAMDDFGTGYSSLSYLRSFPFDRIKIDRSFVSGDPSGGTGGAMAIVRAVAGLGAALGMATVAEGVETPEQMDSIRREGCTDVQGFLISRPISAADIRRLFAEQAEP
ncbi:EAL domain-containing protein [Lichenibacterium minor]|uniref:EAL domain-containing protein n=1 Tax=Lichenibacterium minor TaxID=2316528 RepID=A0A4Q2U0H6_9HYPH|nr:EAL domain-containing protein [Lichenibacterium minor]RYC29138.1 EAL domain-containing protein [Lichenibacterium minor]